MVNFLLLFLISQPANFPSVEKKSKSINGSPVTVAVKGLPTDLCLQFMVDGKVRNFILDTGDLHSHIHPAKFQHGGSDESKILDLRIGKQTLCKVTAYTSGGPEELKREPTVDGFLGCDFLDDVVMLMDSTSATAYFWHSKDATAQTAINWFNSHEGHQEDSHAAERPWSTQRLNVMSDGSLTVRALIQSTAFDLLVDTGTFDTGVSKQILQSITYFDLMQNTYKGYYGPVKATRELVPNLELGFLHEGPTIVTLYSDLGAVENMIGLDRLLKGDWVIDKKNRSFGFRPNLRKEDFKVQTDHFTLTWSGSNALAYLDASAYHLPLQYWNVVAIDGKDFFKEYSVPEDVNSRRELDSFGKKIQSLFRAPFRLRIKNNSVERDVVVDLLK